ncbi:MAG: TIGR00269 family protein [Methanomicrobiales archaeon]|nr:TIGR00269 family protein [Methanomicrobiales archaeon]
MLISMAIACDRCNKEAIIFQPYSGRHLCRQHFVLDFERRAKHEIRMHRWIVSGDTIAIAMSGGKDSSALAFFLKKAFGMRKDIGLFAVSVDEGITGYREMEKIRRIADGIGIDWHSTSFREVYGCTLDEVVKRKGESRSCTYCGVLRRGALNRRAKELSATRLAMGFNLDDEAQSVLMNVLRGDAGRLTRVRVPKEGFIERIKPFRTIPEREVALYAMLHLEGFEPKRCPYAKNALRGEVRAMLNEYSYRHPATKFALIRLGDALPLMTERESIGSATCPSCGEPGSGECSACRILHELEG